MFTYLIILICCLYIILFIKRIHYPRVLLYHSVSDEIPSKKTNISVEKFRKQIQYLTSSGYKFFFMNELFETKRVKEKKIFLTFDDGLKCIYQNVFPILKEFNIKATIYICKNYSGKELLSSEEIKEMSDSGLVEFGAHTLNHANLTKLDLKESKDEICGSKKFVEDITGKTCSSFAYPYGKYKYYHAIQANEAKFDNAVIIGHKIYNYDIRNKFYIPRIEPRGTMNMLQFRIMILFGKYKI